MWSTNKTKIGIIVGFGLIVFVASMVWLPFMNSSSTVQKVSHDNVKKLEESEEKILDFTVHEKTELESKMGGKINLP